MRISPAHQNAPLMRNKHVFLKKNWSYLIMKNTKDMIYRPDVLLLAGGNRFYHARYQCIVVTVTVGMWENTVEPDRFSVRI